jgi:hypothetical protein
MTGLADPMAEIIDGNAIAEEIKGELAAEIRGLGERGIMPGVATLLAGDDYGSKMYRRQIERMAAEIGLAYRDVTLPADAALGDVLGAMAALNRDPAVSGPCRCGRSQRGSPRARCWRPWTRPRTSTAYTRSTRDGWRWARPPCIPPHPGPAA